MSGNQVNRTRQSNKPAPYRVDVCVVNHLSIVLFHLNTPEASEWVEENVSREAQFFAAAVVVEPRYVEALVAGMRAAGLEVR